MKSRRTTSSDQPEVVLVSEVAPILQKWLDKWYAERPSHNRKANEPSRIDYNFYSPLDFITDRTGITDRSIRAILKGEQKHITLSKADDLLVAIGESHRLSNGDIRVVPNPMWTQERWQAYMGERTCENTGD